MVGNASGHKRRPPQIVNYIVIFDANTVYFLSYSAVFAIEMTNIVDTLLAWKVFATHRNIAISLTIWQILRAKAFGQMHYS